MKTRYIPLILALFVAIVVTGCQGRVSAEPKGKSAKESTRSIEASLTQAEDATITPDMLDAQKVMGEDSIFDEEVLMLWPKLYGLNGRVVDSNNVSMMMVPYKNIDDNGAQVNIFRAVRINDEWPSVGKGREAIAIYAKSKVGKLTVGGVETGDYIGSMGDLRFFVIYSKDFDDPKLVDVETRPTWN